jgi:hypothetical protein
MAQNSKPEGSVPNPIKGQCSIDDNSATPELHSNFVSQWFSVKAKVLPKRWISRPSSSSRQEFVGRMQMKARRKGDFVMKRGFPISLIAAALLGGLVTPCARAIAVPNQQPKGRIASRIARQIKASTAVHIYADNSQGSSLYVQEAGVKEISGDEFRALVGEAPRHFRQTTFPEVIMLNGYSKTITGFALIVQSAADKPQSGYILLKKRLSIRPDSTYKVTSSEWLPAETVSVQEGEKFVTRLRQPGLDSVKSWLNGAASDLRVTVGLVEFEDGTRWKISSDSGW